MAKGTKKNSLEKLENRVHTLSMVAELEPRKIQGMKTSAIPTKENKNIGKQLGLPSDLTIKQLERLLESASTSLEELSVLVAQYTDLQSKNKTDDVSIVDDTIRVGDKSVSLSQLISGYREYESSDSVAGASNEVEKLKTALNWASSLKGVTKKAAIWTIDKVIANVIGVIVGALLAGAPVPSIFGEDERSEVALRPIIEAQRICKAALPNYPIEFLFNYRCVSAKNAKVFAEDSGKSRILDEVYLGQTVFFLKKSNRFALVLYQDAHTGEWREGYIAARWISTLADQDELLNYFRV